MKFTQAQTLRIIEIRTQANAVLQDLEDRAGQLIAAIVQRALDDLATFIERNPSLSVDAALGALSQVIDHVATTGSAIMARVLEEAFDASLVAATEAARVFGVLTPGVIEATAQAFEAGFRRDLISAGYSNWYSRLTGEALSPNGPLRSAIESVSVGGESWSVAAKRLASEDPLFQGLPLREIDPLARAREIVRTETTRIDNAVSVGFAEKAGMDKFTNVGVGDTRQSDECWLASDASPMTIEEWNTKRLPGKVRYQPWRKVVKEHFVEAQVVHTAPRHPSCRCILLGVHTGFNPSAETLAEAGAISG